jgi:hypothetical protein
MSTGTYSNNYGESVTMMDVDKYGGPFDYGDPNDANRSEAPAGRDRLNDGVTDPADPDDAEVMLGPDESTSWDMRHHVTRLPRPESREGAADGAVRRP